MDIVVTTAVIIIAIALAYLVIHRTNASAAGRPMRYRRPFTSRRSADGGGDR